MLLQNAERNYKMTKYKFFEFGTFTEIILLLIMSLSDSLCVCMCFRGKETDRETGGEIKSTCE